MRFGHGNDIDVRIRHALRPVSAGGLTTHSALLPAYRYVDVFRAAEATAAERRAIVIDSEHEENLNSILHGRAPAWMSRQTRRASRSPWPVGPSEDAHLPGDRFWVISNPAADTSGVVRVRFDGILDRTLLDVAAQSGAKAEALLQEIVRRSEATSIYRGRLLSLSFETGSKDSYGDVEKPERLRLLFKAEEDVGDDEMIVDDEIRTMLWRNVVDLHERRETLKRHGIPIRRGVLLYGPPGTGKTYACRYLCSKLRGTTRLLVTGMALNQVASMFAIARLFQPSLLILEDVDLVFAAREINLYSSVLGELLDQMDGLRSHEDIGFVLTTNAIERMEAAVRDRPGRVSQVIHFAAPSEGLRARHLRHYLARYDASRLDIAALAELSAGGTQAFLKEWVHRAAQIASERRATESPLTIEPDDFETALVEMRRFGGKAGSRIVGFSS
jgi:SpoVK/Ycf46/Vps4 family AAA+-type ATPase